MKQLLGHDGPPQSPWRENLITGKPLAECPLRTLLRKRENDPALVQEVSQHVRVYFPAFERGVLLVAGGLADQPARYLELMTRIGETRRAVEAKHDEILEEQRRRS